MKQHYIPQCYLRRFSKNEKSIHTYDKISCKSYNAPLSSVCFENDLYTLSDEYVKKSREEKKGVINNLTIEHDHFSRDVEPLYSQMLSQIGEIKEEWVSGKGYYRLKHIEKKELALHIATQYLRHPLIGQAEIDNCLRFEQANVDLVKYMMSHQTGDKGFEDLEIEVTCEKPALHANLTYMNYDALMDCAEKMADNIFVFWVSKGNDFYTSDFPIAVEPHANNAEYQYCGLLMYGGELMMSLSPSLSLSIYDKDYFREDNLDCSFLEANDKEVRRHNMIRYFYAQRHVFSYKNDFSLIEFIYKMKGEHVFMKPHLKAEVVSGLGRY